MAAQENVNRLVKLAQLDIDAADAYTQAIAAIDIPEIRERLIEYRGDHQRHVADLSVAITRLGGKPPQRSPDMTGHLIQGYTTIRAAMGMAGALRAMKSNEALTNATYEAALSLDVPSDIKRVISRNRDDERRHLAYIESALESRVWERRPTPVRSRRFMSDLAQYVPLAVGGLLVANAIFRRSAASIIGGVIGAGLTVAALQSGVNPGGIFSIPSRSSGGPNPPRGPIAAQLAGWGHGAEAVGAPAHMGLPRG